MLSININSMSYPNGYVALKDVKFCFKNHGLYFVVGESGCGKSTFLHCLSGMDSFNGDLIFEDILISEDKRMSYMSDNIGFVFQDYKLFDNLSVEDNVNYAVNMIGKSISKENLNSLLEKLKIDKYKSVKTKLLSGGEKQRVAIARALAKDCPVIVADEPTGNLDSENSDKTIELLREVSKTKLVIVVTHDEYLARKYGDVIIRMADGAISGIEENKVILEDKDKEEIANAISSIDTKSKFKCFVSMALMIDSGAKLFATSLLCVVLSVFTLIFSMLAGQNKMILTKRYFSQTGNGFAQAVYLTEQGQKAMLDSEDVGDYSVIAECANWQVKGMIKPDSESFWQDDALGTVLYCIQLGNKNSVGLDMLYGKLPENMYEIAVPVSIANGLIIDGDMVELLNQTITINTGIVDRQFKVCGIYDVATPSIPSKYKNLTLRQFYAMDEDKQAELQKTADNRNSNILNRSIVIAPNGIKEMMTFSTAEQYTKNTISCTKGSLSFVIYNAHELGLNVAEGEVVLSPTADAMIKAIYFQEYNNKELSFKIKSYDDNFEKEYKFIGIEYSLSNHYAIVLNEQDYYDVLSLGELQYDAIVFDYNDYSVSDMYATFGKINEQANCYVTSAYGVEDFISTVQTIESINIKVMVPLMLIFEFLTILAIYIMIKNIISANVKNISVMRILGIKRNAYMKLEGFRSFIILSAIGAIAILITVALALIINSFNIFTPAIFVFVGWEILALMLVYAVGAAIAITLKSREKFKASMTRIST